MIQRIENTIDSLDYLGIGWKADSCAQELLKYKEKQSYNPIPIQNFLSTLNFVLSENIFSTKDKSEISKTTYMKILYGSQDDLQAYMKRVNNVKTAQQTLLQITKKETPKKQQLETTLQLLTIITDSC